MLVRNLPPPPLDRIKMRTQVGKPFSPDHLVSYVNREVEVKGKENGNVFGLLEIRVVE